MQTLYEVGLELDQNTEYQLTYIPNEEYSLVSVEEDDSNFTLELDDDSAFNLEIQNGDINAKTADKKKEPAQTSLLFDDFV